MSTTHRNLVFVASLLLIIGAFLPWVTITSPFLGVSSSLNGIGGDGIFTAIGGGVLLLISISNKSTPGKNYSIVGLIISVLCFILLFGKFGLIGNGSEDGVIVSIGIGLYASIIGSILGVAGSLMKTPGEALENSEMQKEEVPATADIPTQPKKTSDIP